MVQRRRRFTTGRSLIAVAAAVGFVASACGGESGPPTVTWYVNPDAGGQEQLAAQCTEAAEGEYQITTALLPRDAPGQREQLARRLAAQDPDIDLMSLDPAFIAEFADAGWLTEVPDDIAADVTDGTVQAAVDVSTWNDALVAVPFWANTQLLWYRKSVAEEAGLDLENEPVTWQQLIEAAQSQETLISLHGIREEAYAVWINALVESAGGQIVENPDAPADEIQLTVDSDAGRQAAEIIQLIAREGVGGPGLSNQDEEGAMHQFNGEESAFMLNWPFVWAAINGAVEEGNLTEEFLDDIGWAPYPAVAEGEDARPPYGGISLRDRVAVLSKGVLQQCATPRELYEHPANLFVAGFIGMPSMNFIPARVADGNLQTPFGDADVPADRRGELSGLEVVMIGARPEHFQDTSLMDGDPTEDGMTFEAEIDVIEWLGSEQFAYIPYEAPEEMSRYLKELAREVESEEIPTQLVVSLDPASKLSEGENARLWLDLSKVHVFDPESGNNLTQSRTQPSR
jgi:multiple sugar transport system substrate-binding protein